MRCDFENKITRIWKNLFIHPSRFFDMNKKLQKATFAAGCFWGVEEAFRTLPGVVSTRVGYTGGTLSNPTYENVCSGTTHHAEAIEISFDPTKISYSDLLDLFWRMHDPTTMNRQGFDIGEQYRSAIFFHSNEQKELAEKSKAALEKSKRFSRPIVTQIVSATTFFEAEEYHQKYLLKRGANVCH